MGEPLKNLSERLQGHFADKLLNVKINLGELTLELPPLSLVEVCKELRDVFGFDTLVDVAGVDYLAFGVGEWNTEDSTRKGFSRGVEETSFGRFDFTDTIGEVIHKGPRFAIVYHLLSVANNQRLTLKVYCDDDDSPIVDSVIDVWASANWNEREAFDLYGIIFNGHPDLRRILTDYGFMGHPFRKDFPLVGNVEMRYDPEQGRVIYEPVSIEPRVLVPKVSRNDHRYLNKEDSAGEQAADA